MALLYEGLILIPVQVIGTDCFARRDPPLYEFEASQNIQHGSNPPNKTNSAIVQYVWI